MTHTTPHAPGQLWSLSSEIVLISFIDETTDDVRVVPIGAGQAISDVAHNEVLVPAGENSFALPLLFECWHARWFQRSDLSLCIGELSSDALTAVRAVEFQDILPEEADRWSAWRGLPIETPDEDVRVQRQRASVDDWNSIVDAIRLSPITVELDYSLQRPKHLEQSFDSLGVTMGDILTVHTDTFVVQGIAADNLPRAA